MNDRLIRCRYTGRSGNPCPNPAADQAEDAWVHLCVAHLARAMKCIKENRATAKTRLKETA